MDMELPRLDVGEFQHRRWVADLDAACRHWGCFYLLNHGVSETLLGSLRVAMAAFFARPQAEKRRIERTAENAWGYYDRELTKNRRDWKEIFDVGPEAASGPLAGSTPQWPQHPAAFRSVVEQAYTALELVALELLSGISEALGMPADALDSGFRRDASSFLRLNHYPPCAVPQQHLGISPHTDAGALTVLVHDEQPGLEFLHRGEWRLVAPVPGALVVNIGDIVQVWSNDRYRAPEHRVRAHATQHRYSAPFFLNPSYDTNYAPLESLLEAASPVYRTINWGEFRAGRAAGDYADAGEEIQISQYRCD
ncbi:MAG: 2OG-Fe(II) oxygenase family protein [Halieaceae bacterium]|jgi:isopenicillin N synthase-like dioxygenase|nr:2OG-Fe(II) oxygenase family protein [Halieaceae bacterium]